MEEKPQFELLNKGLDFNKYKEFNIDNIENFENPFNNRLNSILKKSASDIDNLVIDFLKANGYRPKKTEKYFKYIKKKLAKQDLAIRINIYEKRDSDYSWTETYMPEFVKISEMKRQNDYELYKRHILGEFIL